MVNGSGLLSHGMKTYKLRDLCIVGIGLTTILTLSLFQGGKVSAASLYDGVIANGGEAIVSNHDSSYSSYPSCYNNSTNIMSSYASIFNDDSKWVPGLSPDGYQSSYAAALATGGVGLTQRIVPGPVSFGNGINMVAGDSAVMLTWSNNPNAIFYSSPYIGKELKMQGYWNTAIIYYAIKSGVCQPMVVTATSASNNLYGLEGILKEDNSTYTDETWRSIFTDYTVTYPEDYEGGSPVIQDTTDSDGDGLNTTQESLLGTSDDNTDTDGDGLSDFTESPWKTNRDDIFCGASECAYPDPLKKDIYVELDWMNDGTKAYKPTSAQIGMVINMFNDHNINLHIDAGDYGGGNELTTYESPLLNQPSSTQIDYYDYKSGGNGISSNFASDRAGIWHYMISGNRYTYDVDPADSSGWASVMGSNTFIALGYVLDDNSVASQDRAVANTIAHELGHNICLSPTRKYNEQPAQCVYQGIDNGDSGSSYYNLENYESVMNYRYQLTDYDDLGVVKYSEGTNTTNDHDDWSGINSAVGLFNAPRTLYTEFGAGKQRSAVRSNTNTSSNNLDPDGNVVIGENSTPGYSMKK